MQAIQKIMTQTAYPYLIVGAGKSGWSVARHLHSMGYAFRIIDTRKLPPFAKQIGEMLSADEYQFGELDRAWVLTADTIVVSPGVQSDTQLMQEAKQNGAEIIGDIEMFARITTKPYVAITGSNGKSTVTTLVRDMLNAQDRNAYAGANLGEPALDLLVHEDAECYVLELSSFQLETTQSLSAQVAAVLNVSDDHLDRHESMGAYAQIKRSIFDNAKAKVFWRDDPWLKDIEVDSECVSFGLDQAEFPHYGVGDHEGRQWLVKGDRALMPADEIPMVGQHGVLNALAAFAIGEQMGLSFASMAETVRGFKGLAHRCEWIGRWNGVDWYNDSKGTNIGATVAAIAGFSSDVVLIVGGVFKGGDLEPLKDVIRQRVSHVICFGRDANVFSEALDGIVHLSHADTLDACVERAKNCASEGASVLFSPACASFDMFADYRERGTAFVKAVEEIGGRH